MLALPTELVVRVLEFLPLQDLLRCRELSRYFCGIVDGSPSVQYKIDLACLGLEDLLPENMNVNEKHRRLKEFHRNRNQLSLSTTICTKVPQSKSIALWNLSPNTFAVSMDFGELRLVRAPSSCRGSQQQESWSFRVDTNWYFISLDDRLNLAFFLEKDDSKRSYVRLVDLRSGEKHALASAERIPLESLYDDDDFEPLERAIVACDQYIALQLSETPPDDYDGKKYAFYIFDWISGSCIMSSQGKSDHDYLFLDNQHLLVSSADPKPSLQVINFTKSSSPVAIFELFVPFETSVMSMEVVGNNPPPASLPPSPGAPQYWFTCESAVPFGLVTLDLALWEEEDQEEHRFRLACHSSTFLARALQVEAEFPSRTTTAVFSWETWGPQNTRIFANPQTMSWNLSSGSRYVTLEDGNIVVLDFNPYLLRRPILDAHEEGECITEPSSVEVPGSQIPTSSCLPYRKYLTSLTVGEDTKREVAIMEGGVALYTEIGVDENDIVEGLSLIEMYCV